MLDRAPEAGRSPRPRAWPWLTSPPTRPPNAGAGPTRRRAGTPRRPPNAGPRPGPEAQEEAGPTEVDQGAGSAGADLRRGQTESDEEASADEDELADEVADDDGMRRRRRPRTPLATAAGDGEER